MESRKVDGHVGRRKPVNLGWAGLRLAGWSSLTASEVWGNVGMGKCCRRGYVFESGVKCQGIHHTAIPNNLKISLIPMDNVRTNKQMECLVKSPRAG
eukprot:9770500-Ditylum_brightwellii.AAC.1